MCNAKASVLSTYIANTADPVSATYLVSRSVKDCRLSSTERVTVRVKTRVGVTGGRNTDGIDYRKPRESKNARRKRMRYGK